MWEGSSMVSETAKKTASVAPTFKPIIIIIIIITTFTITRCSTLSMQHKQGLLCVYVSWY